MKLAIKGCKDYAVQELRSPNREKKEVLVSMVSQAVRVFEAPRVYQVRNRESAQLNVFSRTIEKTI